MPILSKTHYKQWLICPRYGWHLYHKRIQEETSDYTKSLNEQGYEVERLAHKLFKPGWTVEPQSSEEAAAETKRIIADHAVQTVYQATALSEDNLLAKADIVKINHAKKTLDIYEVKAVNDLGFPPKTNNVKKEEFIKDVTFQYLAFKESLYKIDKVYIVHLNKEFRLQEDQFAHKDFFKYHNLNSEIQSHQSTVAEETKMALADYLSKEAPACLCRFKPKARRCPEFEAFNTDIPSKNSIFSLNRIRPEKVQALLKQDILAIEDITPKMAAELKLSTKQKNQIEVVQKDKIICHKKGIQAFFQKLEFPLYFLDYETAAFAVPSFVGSGPYQAVIFQFSLHVMQANGDLKHYEHLIADTTTQSLKTLIQELEKIIGRTGNILVWHKQAEESFQRNLGQIITKSETFFEGLKKRFFDLEQVFIQQLYVHPDFEGRTSLKAVLPALDIEDGISYKDLTRVADGQEASVAWKKALVEPDKERQEIFASLLEYCKYDTLAMVKIYQFLQEAMK